MYSIAVPRATLAIGYDYATGAGDPLFASVELPIGIGDSLYTLTEPGTLAPAGLAFLVLVGSLRCASRRSTSEARWAQSAS